MTTRNNRGVDNGDTTTVEPVAATSVAAVVALAATPPPPPFTAATTTPRGPSTLTTGLAPFRCGLVLRGGGRRPASSPVSHAGQRSHLWSSSVVGWPDLCAAPGVSTSGGVDTVDDPRRSHLRSSSTAGRTDLCVAPGASTSGGMDTVDDLQRSHLRSSSVVG
jgi:hypothetical protein